MTESKLELQSKVQCKNLIERVLQFRLQLRLFRVLDENQIFKSPAEAEELNKLRICSCLAFVYRVMVQAGSLENTKNA